MVCDQKLHAIAIKHFCVPPPHHHLIVNKDCMFTLLSQLFKFLAFFFLDRSCLDGMVLIYEVICSFKMSGVIKYQLLNFLAAEFSNNCS